MKNLLLLIVIFGVAICICCLFIWPKQKQLIEPKPSYITKDTIINGRGVTITYAQGKEGIILHEASPYPNLTKTRDVHFDYIKNVKERTCTVIWYIWVDNEIIEMGTDRNIKVEDLEAYKHKIAKYANDMMPAFVEAKSWGK